MNKVKILMAKFFPGILRMYFKNAYREDIYKLLKFFQEYENTGSNMMTAFHVMRLDHGWDAKRFARIWAACIYCRFIGGDGTGPVKSIYETIYDKIKVKPIINHD